MMRYVETALSAPVFDPERQIDQRFFWYPERVISAGAAQNAAHRMEPLHKASRTYTQTRSRPMLDPRQYIPSPENADDTEAERFLDQMLIEGEDACETGLQSDEDCESIPF